MGQIFRLQVTNMRADTFFRVVLLIASVLAFRAASIAQETRTPEDKPVDVQRPEAKPPGDGRAEMFRQLGLTSDQIQQIRQINQQRKPAMEEAQKHLRQAMRALDAAIYADQVNEADVLARLDEVHRTQAEVARVRFMNELSIRKVLTAEQLVHFRELRQQFEQARKNLEGRGQPGHERPGKRQIPGDAVKAPQGTKPPIQRFGRPSIQRPSM